MMDMNLDLNGSLMELKTGYSNKGIYSVKTSFQAARFLHRTTIETTKYLYFERVA